MIILTLYIGGVRQVKQQTLYMSKTYYNYRDIVLIFSADRCYDIYPVSKGLLKYGQM